MAGTHTGQAGQGVAGGQLGGDPAASVCGGNAVQATRVDASRIAPITERTDRAMWVVLLEMGVALGLLLLIVWWTWPKKRPEDGTKK